jgi:DHA2 family multidrug resistance protein
MAIGAFGLSFFMRSDWAPDADFKELVVPMMVMGIGMAGFFISMVTICLNGVPPQQVPQASGLINFTRITAGSFAASITTTVWDRAASLHQTRLAETSGHIGNPVWNHALTLLQQRGASVAQSAAGVMQMVVHQAYFLAALDLFRISGWICIALIPLIWLTHSARGAAGAAGGE